MKRLLIFVLLLFGIAACSPSAHKDTNTQAQDTATTKTLGKINSRLTFLEQQIITINNRLYSLDESVATFDPTEPGPYQYIYSDSGQFMVSLKNVTPYLDGQKITLEIGNPQSIQYNGISLDVSWGPPQPTKDAAAPAFVDWFNAIRSKKIDLTNALMAGHWNTVSFVVAPAKSDSFGYLTIQIHTNQVRLYK